MASRRMGRCLLIAVRPLRPNSTPLLDPFPTEPAEVFGELFDGYLPTGFAGRAARTGVLNPAGELFLEGSLFADVISVIVLHQTHEGGEGDDSGLGPVVVAEDQRLVPAAAIELQQRAEVRVPALAGRDDVDGELRQVGAGSAAIRSHCTSLFVVELLVIASSRTDK